MCIEVYDGTYRVLNFGAETKGPIMTSAEIITEASAGLDIEQSLCK